MTDFSDDNSRQPPTPEEDPVPTADFSAAGEHTRELEAPQDYEQHIGQLPSGPESWSAPGSPDDDAPQALSVSGPPAPTVTYPRADPNFFNERATPRPQEADDAEREEELESKVESRFDLAKQRLFDRIDDIGRKRVAAGLVLMGITFVALCCLIFSSGTPAVAPPSAAAPAAQVAPAKGPTAVAAPSRPAPARPRRTLSPMPHSHRKHRHR